jgi:hypothetical protein
MAFEWNRIHKWEDNIEREITNDVETYICEFYNISSSEELTTDQFQEIESYAAEFLEYSVMLRGFENIMSIWIETRDQDLDDNA